MKIPRNCCCPWEVPGRGPCSQGDASCIWPLVGPWAGSILAAPQPPLHHLLTGNQHLLLQDLVQCECYKLICLMGTADLSIFPLLIRAWLRALQAEEVILK